MIRNSIHLLVLLFVIFILNACITYASPKTISEAQLVDFKVIVNNNEFESELPTVVIDGRTYLPLREYANELGLTVDWDAKTETITLNKFEFLESFEGTMDNGVTYSFFGIDKRPELSLKKCVEEYGLIRDSLYDRYPRVKGRTETPKEAAQIAYYYLGPQNPNLERDIVNVFYDFKTDCWVAEREEKPRNKDGALIGRMTVTSASTIITVNRNDGLVGGYTSFSWSFPMIGELDPAYLDPDNWFPFPH